MKCLRSYKANNLTYTLQEGILGTIIIKNKIKGMLKVKSSKTKYIEVK